MGQVADEVIEGLRCNLCGQYMEDGQKPGYPRSCRACCKILGKPVGEEDERNER